MRLNIRKGLLAEIYSGLAKLLSHSGHGALIESARGRVRAVGTNSGETPVFEVESPESDLPELSIPSTLLNLKLTDPTSPSAQPSLIPPAFSPVNQQRF